MKRNRGFPFDEEEGTGAWSELAARHPDIAARLRQRPATWARKRRPSSQDGIDDTEDNFGGFDRFPFDDIPPEFREHFPSNWNRRFGPREEQYQAPQSPQPQSPQQQTTSTQTEQDSEPIQDEQAPLPQYGLRNTVDLGQKSPADPSVVDADERAHRSMSAPPDHRTLNQNPNKMSGPNNQESQSHQHQPEQSSNVRHIPIFVEGRDEPVINKSADHGTHYAETKPTYVPPPQPHIDREQYFADDGPVGFPFAKSFDRPFFRQGPQPFTKQKMYPQQAAYPRGASPQRSQSPKAQNYQEQPPRAETPSRAQQKPAPPQQRPAPQQQKQPSPQQQAPPQQASPQAPSPPPQAPSSNDPITVILSIQTDVLNLMTDVENFKGTKKDKRYLYLDEMLTRNLIKLDNIETDGKENIRQARKEAIKCIQKCIAVLEAKAENKTLSTPQPQDVDMQNTEGENPAALEENVQNGDIEMKETTKEDQLEINTVAKEKSTTNVPQVQAQEQTKEQKFETKSGEKIADNKNIDTTQPPSNEVPPEIKSEVASESVPEPPKTETIEKKSPKKIVKKRDKSKDKKETPEETIQLENNEKEENKKELANTNEMDEKKDLNKDEIKTNEQISVDNKAKEEVVMQVDPNSKGDSNKSDSQAMDVDGAASQ